MGIISPIETHYNGYRFRSRLEARWAIFFDKAGISYEYELEGFELRDYGYYLPDFWLPKFKCWVEIKPEYDDDETQKVMRCFADTIAPIILFRGTPSLSWNGTIYCLDLTDSSGGSYENKIGFAFCHICKVATLSFSDNDRRLLGGGRELLNSDWSEWKTCCDPEHRKSHTVHELADAIGASRAARFEHNEKKKGIL
jgi:hypothetical protein